MSQHTTSTRQHLTWGALPLSFPPDCCLDPRLLFSSSWFSSLSFLYVSSFSSSLRSHNRWRCCPSSRHSPSLCPNLCLHRFPGGKDKRGWYQINKWITKDGVMWSGEKNQKHIRLTNLQASSVSLFWQASPPSLSSLPPSFSSAALSSWMGPLCPISLAAPLEGVGGRAKDWSVEERQLSESDEQ